MKARRRSPRQVSDFAPFFAPLGLGLLLAGCAFGFAHFTRIVLEKQKNFAPDSAHPWDGYAAGCLFLGLAAGAVLLLSLRNPTPMRWRRTRRFLGRRPGKQRKSKRRRKPKPGPGSGTMGLQ